MERRKFLNQSLLGLVLGLLFPSLAQARNRLKPVKGEFSGRPFHGYYIGGQDSPYVVVVTLSHVYSKIRVHISGTPILGGIAEIRINDGLIMPPESNLIAFAIKDANKYRNICVSYQYEDSEGWVNVYIPITRFVNNKFTWNAAKPVKNSGDTISLMYVERFDNDNWISVMESYPSGERRFAVERWSDRIDIYLSS